MIVVGITLIFIGAAPVIKINKGSKIPFAYGVGFVLGGFLGL